jgi:hypothetical protein
MAWSRRAQKPVRRGRTSLKGYRRPRPRWHVPSGQPGPATTVTVSTWQQAVRSGAAGPGIRAIRETGEQRAKATITAAHAPFRPPDGRYRLENAFRYVVARA